MCEEFANHYQEHGHNPGRIPERWQTLREQLQPCSEGVGGELLNVATIRGIFGFC